MSERCQGQYLSFLGYCSRKPTVVRDGKAYCWQHDPERISRLRQERNKRWDAEWKAKEAAWDAADARRVLEIAAGMDKLTDDELRTIAALGGIREMLRRLTEWEPT
jgi:hypothetical protein